jgi:hypothetical protein
MHRRRWKLGAFGIALAVSLASAGSTGAATDRSPPWLTIRSSALNYQFGESYAQETPHQDIVGRLRLDRLARVSSVVIRGRRRTGDLLVMTGKYENLTSQPSYWTEGYAFTFGTEPRLCTLNTCGPLPEGDWGSMSHAFGAPIVDYPLKSKVAPHATISFREAIPLPPAAGSIRTLRDIWLLPIYAAFNYYELPFPYHQLVPLSAYFGRTGF